MILCVDHMINSTIPTDHMILLTSHMTTRQGLNWVFNLDTYMHVHVKQILRKYILNSLTNLNMN